MGMIKLEGPQMHMQSIFMLGSKVIPESQMLQKMELWGKLSQLTRGKELAEYRLGTTATNALEN